MFTIHYSAKTRWFCTTVYLFEYLIPARSQMFTLNMCVRVIWFAELHFLIETFHTMLLQCIHEISNNIPYYKVLMLFQNYNHLNMFAFKNL